MPPAGRQVRTYSSRVLWQLFRLRTRPRTRTKDPRLPPRRSNAFHDLHERDTGGLSPGLVSPYMRSPMNLSSSAPRRNRTAAPEQEHCLSSRQRPDTVPVGAAVLHSARSPSGPGTSTSKEGPPLTREHCGPLHAPAARTARSTREVEYPAGLDRPQSRATPGVTCPRRQAASGGRCCWR